MLRITTLSDHKRMSTRDLLILIRDAVAKGEHDFFISASGQHDIGGPLWSPDGKPLNFEISNPGQRVGGMCLPGTRVVVNGSTPADAGWLNSGGEVIVKGDAGDTTGHCAAAGRILIGGRCGTRTGALMKHDPLFEPPELWILKNTGSFSFEFMGGGKAVVCGHDCLTLDSVLGDRPCVGMVDGVIYFRGKCPVLPAEVKLEDIDEQDIEFLAHGLERFLGDINQLSLLRDLSIWKHWHKIVTSGKAIQPDKYDIASFRKEHWFDKGIFEGEPDYESHIGLVPRGRFRLRFPEWKNSEKCVDCRECLKNCPQHAIKRRGEQPVYSVLSEKCIGCGFCALVCPENVWKVKSAWDNRRQ